MSMTGRYRRISADDLASLRSDPARLLDVLYPDDEEGDDQYLDIDKAWHAIHFLLNGDAWGGEYPLYDAVLEGSPVSNEDLGFGPARYLTPEEVQEVAGALSAVSEARLLRRFDSGTFAAAEIYPDGWRGTAEERRYLMTHFRKLKEFLSAAARADDALLLWLA